LLEHQKERFFGAPRLVAVAQLQLATLELTVGAWNEAERVLQNAPTLETHRLHARLALARGDVRSAQAMASDVLALEPQDVPSLNVLASAALHQGDTHSASTWLGKSLSIAPFDPEAQRLLSLMEGSSNVQ
jgi:Flp pilus assembly protein TadD